MSKKSINTQAIANELEGASVFFRAYAQAPKPKISASKITKAKIKRPKSRSSELPKLRTSDEPNSMSAELPKLRSYEVLPFEEYRRLDIRITWEQKRFLDDWEEDLRRAMPEGDRSNPQFRRVTKNSIMRVLIEIARQLDLRLDAAKFQNETDLLTGVYEALQKRMADIRSSEVPK